MGISDIVKGMSPTPVENQLPHIVRRALGSLAGRVYSSYLETDPGPHADALYDVWQAVTDTAHEIMMEER